MSMHALLKNTLGSHLAWKMCTAQIPVIIIVMCVYVCVCVCVLTVSFMLHIFFGWLTHCCVS